MCFKKLKNLLLLPIFVLLSSNLSYGDNIKSLLSCREAVEGLALFELPTDKYTYIKKITRGAGAFNFSSMSLFRTRSLDIQPANAFTIINNTLFIIENDEVYSVNLPPSEVGKDTVVQIKISYPVQIKYQLSPNLKNIWLSEVKPLIQNMSNSAEKIAYNFLPLRKVTLHQEIINKNLLILQLQLDYLANELRSRIEYDRPEMLEFFKYNFKDKDQLAFQLNNRYKKPYEKLLSIDELCRDFLNEKNLNSVVQIEKETHRLLDEYLIN